MADITPIRAMRRWLRTATLLLSCALPASAACASQRPVSVFGDARQLVLVLADDWDASQARLQRFERDAPGAQWRPVAEPVAVTLGRKGSAWGRGLHPLLSGGPRKREGDGRAPAGVFRLGSAFGYDPQAPDTSMPYTPMQASHWCIDVPGSPHYNRIVDSREVGEAAIEGSTEPMRRDLHLDGDRRYALGLVIEHNADQRAAEGSCIFLHLWKAPGEATAGCTAMDEASLRDLLAWLDPARSPRYVMLPQAIYQRVAGTWRLPSPELAR